MKKVLLLAMSVLMTFSMFSCKKEGTVPYTIRITCDEIVENLDDAEYGIKAEKRDIVPKDGIILEFSGKCSEGDDLMSCATEALRSNKIHYTATNSYFEAIGNLYAGDCGDNSGWLFYVNGVSSAVGANEVIIKENDVFEFKYVVDFMKASDMSTEPTAAEDATDSPAKAQE